MKNIFHAAAILGTGASLTGCVAIPSTQSSASYMFPDPSVSGLQQICTDIRSKTILYEAGAGGVFDYNTFYAVRINNDTPYGNDHETYTMQALAPGKLAVTFQAWSSQWEKTPQITSIQFNRVAFNLTAPSASNLQEFARSVLATARVDMETRNLSGGCAPRQISDQMDIDF
jgi:hypothetical protein